MPLLTKETKSAGDGKRVTEDVYVADLGAYVRIRSLDELEYEDFQDSLYKRRGKNVEANLKTIRRRLVSLCAIDADGLPLWTEDELKRKPSRAMSHMTAVAMRLCGMDDSDLRELAGENQPKNSGAAPGGLPS